MSLPNQDVRKRLKEAKENNINAYQIAEAIGIADTTFSRYLRKEMDLELKMKIFNAIENLNKKMEEV